MSIIYPERTESLTTTGHELATFLICARRRCPECDGVGKVRIDDWPGIKTCCTCAGRQYIPEEISLVELARQLAKLQEVTVTP